MPLIETISKVSIPIAKNHSFITDIVGEAGIYVNCESVSELSGVMENCSVDDSETKNLVKKEYDRASFFTWEKSTEFHTDFYKNL
jgi:hypothetical protein